MNKYPTNNRIWSGSFFILLILNLACSNTKSLKSEAQPMNVSASDAKIEFIENAAERKVDVKINGDYFTAYIYPGNIAKPVLYPLITTSGKVLTRRYPLEAAAGERVDHPHHVGYWLNYGDVNGLDFWNNSEAIPADRKNKYGTIYHEKILKQEEQKGLLAIQAVWRTPDETDLLRETTEFHFAQIGNTRIIDRQTTLVALEDVSFTDNKEGMVGLRVTRALEFPEEKPVLLTGANGEKMDEPVLDNEGVRGDYLSSEGVTGGKVWGTRAKWMKLHSVIEEEPVSLTLIDHPDNVGYPTYWHARTYGLFAANPLGQKIFSKGKEELNFKLGKGESTTFKYRLLIHSGSDLSAAQIEGYFEEFRGE